MLGQGPMVGAGHQTPNKYPTCRSMALLTQNRTWVQAGPVRYCLASLLGLRLPFLLPFRVLVPQLLIIVAFLFSALVSFQGCAGRWEVDWGHVWSKPDGVPQ